MSVTFESREQAATSTGVQKAADAAQVYISPAQAVAIANAIKEVADKAPDNVVQINRGKLENTVREELHKSGGQFAIVTEPKETPILPALAPIGGKAINALNVGNVMANTPVTLNQYNIKAYPDRLIQIGGSYQEVFAAYNWRVSVPKIPLVAPHGGVGYLGVYGHANFDHPDISGIGIMLTIPK